MVVVTTIMVMLARAMLLKSKQNLMTVRKMTPKIALKIIKEKSVKLKMIKTLAILKNVMSNMMIFKMITVTTTTGRAATL